MKQGDLLAGQAPQDMPPASAASLFLNDLVHRAGSSPSPGKVLR